MGRKYFWRQYSYTRLEESGNPGCISGLLKLLGHHQQWRGVKRILPGKKQSTGGRRRRTKNSKVNSDEGRITGFSEHEKLAGESDSTIVEWENPAKISTKGRIRELITEEDNSKRSVSSLPRQSKSLRAHLKEASKHNNGAMDVYEIFKVNKNIFHSILSDHDLALLRQPVNPSLTKSGSFPSANVSRCGPSSLDDKVREVRPPLKGVRKSKSMKEDGGALKGSFGVMRRASSLTESMDRYEQLFDSTFNREIKRSLSKSLKLVDESGEHLPRFMNKVVDEEMRHQEEERDEVELESVCDSEEDQELVYTSEEIPEIVESDQFLPVIVQEQESESDYVKLILELSGFMNEEQAWPWHSVNSPINPALFEAIEARYCQQKDGWTTKDKERDVRKQIFDLVNEALVDIDEGSGLYYPRAFSSNCRVRPTPEGHRLLEEVWCSIGRWLRWRPEVERGLDSAVAKDLDMKNGWMNLQIESECVGLELEDMILDDLLDEIFLAP